MKHLLLLFFLCAPVAAHEGHHHPNPQSPTPEVDAELYLNDYVDHGFITGYGREEVKMGWDMEVAQRRLVVPAEVLPFLKYPFHTSFTTW